MVKLVILLLTGPFIEFERKEFFLLRNLRKIDGTFKSVRAIHSVQPIRVRPSLTVSLLIFNKVEKKFWSKKAKHKCSCLKYATLLQNKESM